MSEQPYLYPSADRWIEVKDGNATGRSLYRRHYSYRRYADGRNPALFVPPGEKFVLLTPCARALFVWVRQDFRLDGETGVCCSVFRNEGAGLSSELIRAADALADERWPGQRHYTQVNGKKIRGTNPGYCFWWPVGIASSEKRKRGGSPYSSAFRLENDEKR